jgi:hypothetical protein
MARGRPAAGRDPGAQGQAADIRVPCRPKGDAFQGAEDIGRAGLFKAIFSRLQEGELYILAETHWAGPMSPVKR